ncbi:MAG: outer membrane beta-barrel protein [Cellulophaga sp.]
MIKKIYPLLLVFLLSISTKVIAQEIYLETGKTVSSFDYKNSQGITLDNLQASSHNYISAGYSHPIFTDKLKLSLGASYAGYGAIGSDDALGNRMKWDINYLEFILGLNYTVVQINTVSLYVRGAASVGFLLQGTQTFNNKIIDLKGKDDFDKALRDFRVGGGLQIYASDKLTFYIQYMYGKTLSNTSDSNQAEDKEVLRIQSSTISLGVAIQLFKK